MSELDPEAYAGAGYPHIVDTTNIVWALYALAGTTLPHEDVAARIEDGTVFEWLHEEFAIPRPNHEDRFLDYLRRSWDVEDYGIRDRGLLLLHAHCVEAMQQALSFT